MRILGLDVGTKRIGVSMSDELLLTAQGMQTIYRNDLERDLEMIAKLVKEYSVLEVVVGLPLSMDGSHSAKTKEVVEFMDNLSRAIDVPIKTWDERLTTVMAERAMLEGDMSRAKRRKLTDKLAAQIILQGYLDRRRKGQTNV